MVGERERERERKGEDYISGRMYGFISVFVLYLCIWYARSLVEVGGGEENGGTKREREGRGSWSGTESKRGR